MNKNYIHVFIICLASSFVMNGMQETEDEIRARRQHISEQVRRHRAEPIPDYKIVYVTEIDNGLNKKVTIDVGFQGQPAYAGEELQEYEMTNIMIPLAHRGMDGFPVISLSIEGTDKVLKYRPSGSTPKVKLRIIQNEDGDIELQKSIDEK